ncbi:DUF4760 domain-containing protein [Neptunicella sp.]|uniref:DUF4760 domain-containing protein n=1 Tax=Neptunicella sp. TaxID=2125986 RepID=UPI003F68C852
MISISELGDISDFIAAIGVISSIVYLAKQIRESQKSSEREVAFQMLRSYATTELMNVMHKVFEMPSGLNKQQIEKYFDAELGVLFAYMGTWESIGIMVHKQQLQLGLAADFFSYPILHSWKKLEAYVEGQRKEVGRDTPWEWFQWLNDQIIRHEAKNKVVPAHIEFKNWQPKLKK